MFQNSFKKKERSRISFSRILNSWLNIIMYIHRYVCIYNPVDRARYEHNLVYMISTMSNFATLSMLSEKKKMYCSCGKERPTIVVGQSIHQRKILMQHKISSYCISGPRFQFFGHATMMLHIIGEVFQIILAWSSCDFKLFHATNLKLSFNKQLKICISNCSLGRTRISDSTVSMIIPKRYSLAHT